MGAYRKHPLHRADHEEWKEAVYPQNFQAGFRPKPLNAARRGEPLEQQNAEGKELNGTH